MKFLYSIPGMEDVEDVIVSSGPNTWPNWRNFSDRIIQPGDIVFMDLAALTWNGYKSCYYRTYCVGKEADRRAEGHLRDGAQVALRLDRRGEGRHDDARDRLEVAVSEGGVGLRGRGPGGGQPVGPRARARSVRPAGDLAHLVARSPDRDQAGMVFALETQHGKMFRWGVRIEEMLIVHEDRIEIISNFPVQQITVVDPMPGYGAHVK